MVDGAPIQGDFPLETQGGRIMGELHTFGIWQCMVACPSAGKFADE